ncbi:MAG: hypothetical protein AB1510_02930 [Bacillota bacterium]
MYLLLTLGEYQQHSPRLAVLDWGSKKIVDGYTYSSPDFPGVPSNSFRGGTLYNGLFYVCTFNELLVMDISTWTIRGKFSRPTFNDLHDVYVDENGIWVCSTGLECAEHYSHDFELLQRVNMSERNYFDKEHDYRLYEIDKRTTPRKHHINNVVNVKNKILITRGKSASVSTIDGRVVIDNLPGMPHDGFVFNDEFYLTIVKGFVQSFEVGSWKLKHTFDLNKCYKENVALGWCRGLAVDNQGMFVGFTKFRPSKSLDYIRWIPNRQRRLNTRVARYSFGSNSIEEECILKSSPGTTTLLYGIYLI